MASVVVMARSIGSAFSEAPAPSAVTDQDGRYRLALDSEDYVVRAKKPGYAADRSIVYARSRGAALDFVLAPGASLVGHVVDRSTGRAVPGARLVANDESGPGEALAFPTPSAVTDVRGAFALGDLHAGTWRLTASAERATTYTPTWVTMAAGDTRSNVDVWVEHAYRVEGRLGGGTPSTGVWVGARNLRTGESVLSASMSEADGHFVIDALRPAAYALDVFRPGALPRDTGARIVVADGDIVDQVVPAGDEHEGSARSKRAGPKENACSGVLSGTVAGEDDRPAPGIRVVAQRESVATTDGADGGPRSALTQADDGTFRIGGLCPGTYELRACWPVSGLCAAERAVALADRVTLHLRRPSSLVGLVRSATSAEKGFSISLAGPVERSEELLREKDHFALPSLPSGTYDLRVESDAGYSTQRVDVPPNTEKRVTVDLVPWSQLRGRLVEDERGASGITVTMVLDPEERARRLEAVAVPVARSRRTVTDAEGGFAFAQVPAHAVRLSFRPPSGRVVLARGPYAERFVTSDGGSLAVELHPGEPFDLGTIAVRRP
jgi:hypothetical protein